MKENNKKEFLQNNQRVTLNTKKINKFVFNWILAMSLITIPTFSVSKVQAQISFPYENSSSDTVVLNDNSSTVCPVRLISYVGGPDVNDCIYKVFKASNCAGGEFLINLPCSVKESFCHMGECIKSGDKNTTSDAEQQTEDVKQMNP
jgi:hypothetical protein